MMYIRKVDEALGKVGKKEVNRALEFTHCYAPVLKAMGRSLVTSSESRSARTKALAATSPKRDNGSCTAATERPW